MEDEQITERASNYNHLEKMSSRELLSNMNKEDQTVPKIIEKKIFEIEKLLTVIVERMEQGEGSFILAQVPVAGWWFLMLLKFRPLLGFRRLDHWINS